MPVHLTVVVPYDAVAAIKEGIDASKTADAVATITKAVIASVNDLLDRIEIPSSPEDQLDASMASFDSNEPHERTVVPKTVRPVPRGSKRPLRAARPTPKPVKRRFGQNNRSGDIDIPSSPEEQDDDSMVSFNSDEPAGRSAAPKAARSVSKPLHGRSSQRDLSSMQVFLRGVGRKVITLNVTPQMTVLQLKELILERYHVPLKTQHLMASPGRPLLDNKTLAEHGIEQESDIRMVLGLKGS